MNATLPRQPPASPRNSTGRPCHKSTCRGASMAHNICVPTAASEKVESDRKSPTQRRSNGAAPRSIVQHAKPGATPKAKILHTHAIPVPAARSKTPVSTSRQPRASTKPNQSRSASRGSENVARRSPPGTLSAKALLAARAKTDKSAPFSRRKAASRLFSARSSRTPPSQAPTTMKANDRPSQRAQRSAAFGKRRTGRTSATSALIKWSVFIGSAHEQSTKQPVASMGGDLDRRLRHASFLRDFPHREALPLEQLDHLTLLA